MSNKKSKVASIVAPIKVRKVDFNAVNFVYDGLFDAFHPEGLEPEVEPDPRFLSLWTNFLLLSGWANEEFWDELERRCENDLCPDCGQSRTEHDENELSLVVNNDADTTIENKPN